MREGFAGQTGWRAIRAVTLLALAGLAAMTSAQAGEPRGGRPKTRLYGVIADPVSEAGVPDAFVRMGKAAAKAHGGRYSVQLRGKSAAPFQTEFSAPGYDRYETWAEAGTKVRRDVYLLPSAPRLVPGYTTLVQPWQFREHFDAVYRSDHDGQFPKGLARWLRQPIFSVLGRVLVPFTDARGRRLLRATGERLTEVQVRNLESALSNYVGPLTGGLFSGDVLEVRRLSEGDTLDGNAEAWPEGVVQVMVLDLPSNSAGGGAIAVDGVLVSGQITLRRQHLTSSTATRYVRTLVHELAHALGMRHGFHALPSPSVPLCSIMGNYECDFSILSPLDLIVARMAYARLPGNGLDDRDPPPAEPNEGAEARRGGRVIDFDRIRPVGASGSRTPGR